MGDYIGISGIEGYYEEELRGTKGQEVLLVDVHGRVKGPYQNGRFDNDAVVGKKTTFVEPSGKRPCETPGG